MPTRRTTKGQRGSLGAELGRGGEGTIYEVPNRPDIVAKLWKSPSDAKARKLDALLRSRPRIPTQAANRILMAWPQQALRDSSQNTIGFLMPRAERGEYREFVRYSIPSARAELENELGVSVGERELLGIARNVAETFELVHANFCLIGDVNHTNFLVNPDTSVFLIDVDSMQVSDRGAGKTYRCEVGTPDFTPPRLMGKRLSDIDRAPDDDHFGLAVLIFQLLMEGNHPYDPVDSAGTSASGNARLENIRNGHSPYTAMLNEHAGAWLTASEIPDPALRQRMQQHILVLIEGDSDTNYTALIDRRATAWLELNSKLQDLFRRAFPNDHSNANPSRPTPREWIDALEEAVAAAPSTPAPIAQQQHRLVGILREVAATPSTPAPIASPQTAAPSPLAARPRPQTAAPPTPKPGDLLWKYDTGDKITFAPTVADGTLYVWADDSHGDCQVYALDARNGDLLWKKDTLEKVESSPMVADGRVWYVGVEYKEQRSLWSALGLSEQEVAVYSILGLDARTGDKDWSLDDFAQNIKVYLAVADDGMVYVGRNDGWVVAWNGNDSGGAVWKYETGDKIIFSPTVADGVVYVWTDDSYDDCQVYALDADTGGLLLKEDTRKKVAVSPMVADGVVYIGARDSRIYARDSWGDILWEYNTGDEIRFSPTVADGVVYVWTDDSYGDCQVYALDARTGVLLWEEDTRKKVTISPTVADGVVYVWADDSFRDCQVYARDARTGSLLWEHDTEEEVAVSPTVADGVVYIGADDGCVYALSTGA